MDETPHHSSPNIDSYGTGPDSPIDATDGGWAFESQAHYDPTDPRDLTTVIIAAIAEAEGVSITDIVSPPLYEVVDVAAIEQALFSRPDTEKNGTESAVEFRYNQHKVSVEADGWVTVSKHPEESSADHHYW